jgi:hypothetical protein
MTNQLPKAWPQSGGLEPDIFRFTESYRLPNSLREEGETKSQEKEKMEPTLKTFCQETIKWLGSGYCYVKIARIPPKKASNLPQIIKKVSRHYQTDLSRGKRQYRRLQGRANYGLAYFGSVIVVFRSPGEHDDAPGEFIEAADRLEVQVSEHLGLVFHRGEHKRLTVRLNRQTLRWLREDFRRAILKDKKRDYMQLRQMWLNLPRYRGVGKQGRDLNKQLITWLRQNSRLWPPLYGSKNKNSTA